MGFGRNFLRGVAGSLNPEALKADNRRIEREELAKRQQQSVVLQAIQAGSISPENSVAALQSVGLDNFTQQVQTPFQQERFEPEPNADGTVDNVDPAIGGLANEQTQSLLGAQPAKPTAPKRSNLNVLQGEKRNLIKALRDTPGNPLLKQDLLDNRARIKKEVAIGKGQTINLGRNTLGASINKKLGGQLVENREKAFTAVDSTRALNETVKILNEGIFTGAFANVQVAAEQIAGKLGFTDTDKSSRTQAFLANQAKGTLALLSSGALGAGTGISDKDREFADRVVANDITLDEKAIKRIMNLTAKVNSNIIKRHNKDLRKLIKNFANQGEATAGLESLLVEEPSEFVGFEKRNSTLQPQEASQPNKIGRFTVSTE